MGRVITYSFITIPQISLFHENELDSVRTWLTYDTGKNK